ncbi:MAG TPA: alpha/beta hydrolase [Xanthobacteraceae bacterium]|jgi:pimeloyl-ACP methyl ester carboxylesterase|nr:alpha/beta hydrolase [Xanthobacteraceae bacterium]
MSADIRHVRTPSLDIAYEEHGAAGGTPVFLMHGWPYDPRCYDKVVPPLVAAGCRVVVPYLRGFGATRFLSADTPRSGQQAALGNDLRELMDALQIERAVLAGYDWGGRAACVVAALWPERVQSLITVNGYMIQDIPGSARPQAPAQEHRFWYQWYFQTERGRAGLEADRRAFCRMLWQLWSPHWAFDEATFARSAGSFDNPDFVAVTIHSYRHRYGNAPDDPAMADIERRLTAKPKIIVPTISLQGEADGVLPPELSDRHAGFFTGPYQRHLLPRIGHNPPQEAPQAFADAVLSLVSG